MTCNCAHRAGYTKALEKVRAFANKKFEEAQALSESETSEKPYWWRAQGKKDFILDLLGELSTFVGEME